MTKVSKKDTKDFIWNAVGLSFNAFNSLFFLVAVKLINGIDEAGIFTYAFSLCCLFYIVALFFNRTYQVSNNSEDFCFKDYLTFRIISSVFSIILIILFCLVSHFDWYKTLVIALLMIFRVIEAISDCFYGEMQKNNELYKSGISLTIKAIVGFLSFLIIDILTHNIFYAIIGLIAINVLTFFIYDFGNVRESLREKVSISKQNIKNLVRVTWPVFVFSLLSMFLANCQKYILTYFSADEIQAIFGIIIMPATMLGLAGSYLINPFTLKLSQHKKRKAWNEFFNLTRKIILAISLIGLLALIICGAIGIPILNFIYQMDLSSQWMNLNIIIITAIISTLGMILSSILTILEQNKKQVVIYLMATIAALISSLCLIPSYGIDGAVISYLISNLFVSGGFLLVYFTKSKRSLYE